MSTHTAPDSAIDAHALDPVAEELRQSTAGHQFWIWAGANIAPINWVLGALGIVLGLSLRDTIVVLVLGNLVGMAIGSRRSRSTPCRSRSSWSRR